jgi:hypothetical protein
MTTVMFAPHSFDAVAAFYSITHVPREAPNAVSYIDLSSSNSLFGSTPMLWLGSRAMQRRLRDTKHVSIVPCASTCRGRQPELGDPELDACAAELAVQASSPACPWGRPRRSRTASRKQCPS